MPKKGPTRVKQSASKSSKLNPLYAEKSWAATHAKFVKQNAIKTNFDILSSSPDLAS
jgi:hypothetical protein